MNRYIGILLVLLAVNVESSVQGAGCRGSDGCNCHVQCPSCTHYCELTSVMEKVKNTCYEVECKPICIPRVTFPWQKCCEPKCAELRYVKVLKKITYECEQCRYKWVPKESDSGKDPSQAPTQAPEPKPGTVQLSPTPLKSSDPIIAPPPVFTDPTSFHDASPANQRGNVMVTSFLDFMRGK